MSQTAKLLKLLGTDLPVIQAPMAGVQDSRLTIAACRAGALGSLPAAMLSAEKLIEEIATIRNATCKPFNINFFAHTQPAFDESVQAAWLEVLKPYYQEFGLSGTNVTNGGGRQPFAGEQAAVITHQRPPVVSFHFGLPEKSLLQKVKDSDAAIMSSATTVDEALWLADHGADIIIAQGTEAGGHRGMFLSQDLNTQSGLFSLLPRICRAVNLPVVAAGGISDAQTAKAACQLGAAGIQIGTALLLADEAGTSAAHRAALQSGRAGHTALTNAVSGGYARGISNRYIRELGIHPKAPPFPLAQSAFMPLKTAAEASGSDEFSSFWCGQNALLASPGSAAQIIESIASGFAGN